MRGAGLHVPLLAVGYIRQWDRLKGEIGRLEFEG